MASYKSNFIKCIIIVFYFIINIDNAYCPEENECQSKMKWYVGSDLTDVLKCAQKAITKYQTSAEISYKNEFGTTSNYIKHYLYEYVVPFISVPESLSLDEFCSSTDILHNIEITNLNLKLYVDPHFVMTNDTDNNEIIKEACKRTLQYFNDLPVEKIIFKDFERFTGNPFEKEYLRAYSEKISLKETAESKERKTPQQYCRSIANK